MVALLTKPVKKIIPNLRFMTEDEIAGGFPAFFYQEYGYKFAWSKYQSDQASAERNEDRHPFPIGASRMHASRYEEKLEL